MAKKQHEIDPVTLAVFNNHPWLAHFIRDSELYRLTPNAAVRASREWFAVAFGEDKLAGVTSEAVVTAAQAWEWHGQTSEMVSLIVHDAYISAYRGVSLPPVPGFSGYPLTMKGNPVGLYIKTLIGRLHTYEEMSGGRHAAMAYLEISSFPRIGKRGSESEVTATKAAPDSAPSMPATPDPKPAEPVGQPTGSVGDQPAAEALKTDQHWLWTKLEVFDQTQQRWLEREWTSVKSGDLYRQRHPETDALMHSDSEECYKIADGPGSYFEDGSGQFGVLGYPALTVYPIVGPFKITLLKNGRDVTFAEANLKTFTYKTPGETSGSHFDAIRIERVAN